MKRILFLIAVACLWTSTAFAQTPGQSTVIRTRTIDPTNCTAGAEIWGNTGASPAVYKGCPSANTPDPFVSAGPLQKLTYNFATDSGTANTYAVTLSPAPASLTVGLSLYFKAANSNTGASTLNVNGLGATSIMKYGSTAVASGDIAAGKVYHVVYDGTNFELVSLPGNLPNNGNVSSSGTPTAGQAAEWTDSTHIQGVATAGGGTSYVKATITSLAQNQVLCGDATPKIINCTQGVAGRTVTTTTDTIASGDRLTTIVYNSASAVATAVTSAATLGSNFSFGAKNEGAGAVTLTLGAGAWSTGGTTLVLNQGDNCTFNSPDNTNFLARCSHGQITAGTNIVLTRSATGVQVGTTATTVTTTGSPASPNLGCFSGAATITNCANVSAHQFRGNNTASAAAETPSLIGASDSTVNIYAADSGAANAYVVSPTPAVTALTTGVQVTFTTANANTGASTINVSGLGVKNVTKKGATALASGDILASAVYTVEYDGTQWELLNPSATSGSGTVTTTGTPANNNLACFSGGTSITNCNLSGDATTSGTSAVTVVKVNGGSVPASAKVLGSNGSSQPVSATQGDVSSIAYAAGGGTAQAQTVTLAPAVAALAAGLRVSWLPTAANTAAAPTLAVNGLTATAIVKCGSGALVANDLTTTAVATAIYDGTSFELQNPQSAGCGAGGGNLSSSGSPVANQVAQWVDATHVKGIDFPDYHYFPAAANEFGTAAGGWDCNAATPAATLRAGTNNLGAFLGGGAGGWSATDTCQISIGLPADWDTATNPNLRLKVASTDTTSGHTIIMQVATECSKGDGSTTDDVAFNAAQSFSTVTLNVTANQQWDATLTNITMTGCVGGGILRMKVSRTTDTATNVRVYGMGITIPRLLTVQAN